MACNGVLTPPPTPPPKKKKIGNPPSPKIPPPPLLLKLFTPSAFFTHGYFQQAHVQISMFVIEKDIFLELNRCIFQRSLTVC